MMLDKTWHRLTLEDLAEGSKTREEIERTLEDWAPNHVSESGRVTGYDEWIERAEGIELADGTYLDLGPEYDSPEWRALKKIANQIAREIA